jgi:hypothetical protein
MPYPAEWLAILLTFVILALQNFSLYDAVDVVLAKVPGLNDLGLTIVGLQWLMGLFFSIAVVLALILLGVAKKRIPDWGKTVLLTGVAVIASVGPLWAIMTHGADLISPSEGFGPGSTGILYHEACMDLASVPLGLLFGIPAVAAMTERLRGFRWNWTEWVGFNASIIVILGLGMLHRAEFPELSWGWLVERLILLVWYLIVALLGRLFLVYVNPIWERAIGLSKDQDRSADAASSSLSSIP